MTKQTTLLIDTSNLICQLFHRRNKQDKPVEKMRAQVISDVRKTVKTLTTRYGADYVLAGIDHESNFRKEINPRYKGKRKAPPQALRELLRDGAEIIRSAGAIPIHAPGFEADDVLATLAARAPGKTVIASADTDLNAVVNENVILHLPNWENVRARDVREKYQIPPERLPLYKALMGDEKDNFRGVRGITHDEAVSLCRRFTDMHDLLRHVDDLPHHTKQKIKHTNPMRLQQNYLISKLVTDAPITQV